MELAKPLTGGWPAGRLQTSLRQLGPPNALALPRRLIDVIDTWAWQGRAHCCRLGAAARVAKEFWANSIYIELAGQVDGSGGERREFKAPATDSIQPITDWPAALAQVGGHLLQSSAAGALSWLQLARAARANPGFSERDQSIEGATRRRQDTKAEP